MEDFYTIGKTFGELEIFRVFKFENKLYIKRSDTQAHTPYVKSIHDFSPSTAVKIHNRSGAITPWEPPC